MLSHLSVGISVRSNFWCPRCPPGLRFDFGFFSGGGFACGCSVEGGLDELREFFASFASSSVMRSLSSAMSAACCSSKVSTSARTAGVISLSNSAGISDIRVMHKVSQISRFKERLIRRVVTVYAEGTA